MRSGVVIASVGGLGDRVVIAGTGIRWWGVEYVGVLMGLEGGFPFGVEGGPAADHGFGIVVVVAAVVAPIAGGLAFAPLQQLAPPPLPVLHVSGVL